MYLNACAEALTSERNMSDGIIDFGTYEWTSFLGSEGFLSWFDAELSRRVRLGSWPRTLTLPSVDKSFDSCIYADSVDQIAASSGTDTVRRLTQLLSSR